jgi:lysophospholipase L1-like esterase
MQRLKVQVGVSTLALLMVAGAAFAAGVTTGTVDISKYVAFGDSLTAGYSSGALEQTYQVNSYPALIYRQVNQTTSDDGFAQPLVSDPGLGSMGGILVLQSLLPVTITPTPTVGQPINLAYPLPYNNMAIPGATLHDLLTKTQSTSAGDPTDLVLRRQGATQLQEGLSLKPTFVTLWIGNNDALGAATSGIVIDGVTITPTAQFETDYRAVVTAIATEGAKMALANIPDVTSIPFVTTVPRFVVNPATNEPVLGPDGQPIPLIGPNGPLQAGDFVLLTATAELAQGQGVPTALGGTGVPLTDSVVLSAAEVASIKAHVAAYNAVIAEVAMENGAALVDANTALANIAANGLEIGGISFSSAFLTGGIFGYDGVHPTAFGYAYIANQFIDAINTEFAATIPPVDYYPYIFGPLPKSKRATAPTVEPSTSKFTRYIFTSAARISLLESLGVPKAIIDGTYRAPKPKPRPHH